MFAPDCHAGLVTGQEGLAGEEEAGFHHLQLGPAIFDLFQHGWNVDFLHEAIANEDAVEAAAQIAHTDATLVRHIGHFVDHHRQDHDAFVQDLVVLQIVQQRLRHAHR